MLAACPTPTPGTGLPCDVADVVGKKCSSCHGPKLMLGAPQRLVTLADFTTLSPLGESQTYAQRSLTRMKDTSAPMPPSYAPQLTAAELAAFEGWVNARTPSGDCPVDPDAGIGFDAGGPQITCTTGVRMPRPTTTAPRGGEEMAPGFACSACHRGQDFQGQNPGGLLGMTPPFDVGGTVYATLNEEDLCVSSVGDAGIVVEILDDAGVTRLTAPVNLVGNFYIPLDAGMPRPYTARVRRGSATRLMTTPQTDGDCNICHTELGREQAPGRIIAP